ncbi:MAG: flagellar biosynthesis anti-sigma factor FlgM [Desulfosarcina sp.]|nr:flagellar biosynthesis anti-sigma factor FlgM [Desulfosarcina sp.]MBC2742065.1 flagellar biosynthesis anti-sigma factor FlgM [Desulfosarcina sp.]MBC2764978.1 flagellar biosynthesis anti-sigma factor FlgM [Desulfosarcina sp.]
MEIPEKGPLQSLPAQNRQVEEIPQPTVEPNGAQRKSAERDTVSLTERGREFNAAVQHAHLLPEIREDLVMQLKHQVEAGTYRVKGHRIAVNMINETLENNNVLKHIDTKA